MWEYISDGSGYVSPPGILRKGFSLLGVGKTLHVGFLDGAGH